MDQFQLRGDPLWDQPCLAYNIQAGFDAQGTAQVAHLQAKALARCGGGMRPTPPHAFHVSIFSIIPVRWPATDKESLWKQVEA